MNGLFLVEVANQERAVFGNIIKCSTEPHYVHFLSPLQAQEEIRILEHLRKQDKDNTHNIIHLFDHFTFRNHTCITFELLSINLYELIKKNKFQGFSLQGLRLNSIEF